MTVRSNWSEGVSVRDLRGMLPGCPACGASLYSLFPETDGYRVKFHCGATLRARDAHNKLTADRGCRKAVERAMGAQ